MFFNEQLVQDLYGQHSENIQIQPENELTEFIRDWALSDYGVTAPIEGLKPKTKKGCC